MKKKEAIQNQENNPVLVFLQAQVEQGQKTLGKVEAEVSAVVQKLIETSGLDVEAGKDWVGRLYEQFEKSRAEFEKQLSERVTEVINRVGLATRDQIVDLAHRVEILTKRVEALAKDRTSAPKVAVRKAPVKNRKPGVVAEA